jgi:hypothetical protein
MKKYSTYMFIASFLSILIPTPGRFVFGLTILFELFLFTLIGTLFNYLFPKLKINELKTFLLLMILLTFSILYRQIFIIFQTEVAFVLGFLFYIPPLSLFLITILIEESHETIYVQLKNNLKLSAIFCISGLILFLFRDIVCFGTITFFGKNHMIYEKILFDSDITMLFSFCASIPGILILCSSLLLIIKVIKTKISSIQNLESQNDLS